MIYLKTGFIDLLIKR